MSISDVGADFEDSESQDNIAPKYIVKEAEKK